MVAICNLCHPTYEQVHADYMNLINDNGNMALALAVQHNHTDCVQLIEHHIKNTRFKDVLVLLVAGHRHDDNILSSIPFEILLVIANHSI